MWRMHQPQGHLSAQSTGEATGNLLCDVESFIFDSLGVCLLQFMFEVGGREEEVLICLQQEDRRIRRKHGGGENLPIGFEVLKVRPLLR